jgi:hypothetical protein
VQLLELLLQLALFLIDLTSKSLQIPLAMGVVEYHQPPLLDSAVLAGDLLPAIAVPR